jgi:hypothetical protein
MNEVVYLKLPVAIDAPIANTIKKLNKNDLLTTYCCAGHEDAYVVYINNGKQENVKEHTDETALYISFAYTENTRDFLEYITKTLDSMISHVFGCIIREDNKTTYVSNLKYYNRIIIEKYANDFTIRIKYNTNKFAKNQTYCIKFLNKIIKNYINDKKNKTK